MLFVEKIYGTKIFSEPLDVLRISGMKLWELIQMYFFKETLAWNYLERI